MYKLNSRSLRIVKSMEVRGYFFDALESRKGWLRFHVQCGGVVSFPTWKEVELWMEGVVWDG